MGNILHFYSPDDARVNPSAHSDNAIQIEAPAVRPTINLDPDLDPADEGLNFTRVANAGDWDYQVVPDPATDTEIVSAYWIDTAGGATRNSAPIWEDVNGNKLDTRAGVDAVVTFNEVSVFCIVTTKRGNILLLELS